MVYLRTESILYYAYQLSKSVDSELWSNTNKIVAQRIKLWLCDHSPDAILNREYKQYMSISWLMYACAVHVIISLYSSHPQLIYSTVLIHVTFNSLHTIKS